MAIIKYKKRIKVNNPHKKEKLPSKKKEASPPPKQRKPKVVRKKSQKEILEKAGIYHFDTDIRLLKRKDLAKQLASGTGRIILIKLMKNIIWQAYEKISAGEADPIEGNIRTFWYIWIKPVLSHIPDDDKVRTDPYNTFLKAFSSMVMDMHLFRYANFDFTDENWEYRRIGEKHPQIVLFAEKRGWIRYLRRFHQQEGISIITLGGAPSALTSEYTLQHIMAALPQAKTPLHLIGIVDYDPSGEMIANAFKKQLLAAGASSVTLKTLITPKHYKTQELAMFKYPLPKLQKTKTQNWINRTGGIEGKAFGLESESFPKKKLSELIQREIKRLRSRS